MKLRALRDTIIVQDHIPTHTRGIFLPESLRARFNHSNAKWATVISVGPKVPKGAIVPGEMVLSHRENAQSLPDLPNHFVVPWRSVLTKTQ
jgi:hypothetical protein